jgi:hypothetical protein
MRGAIFAISRFGDRDRAHASLRLDPELFHLIRAHGARCTAGHR